MSYENEYLYIKTIVEEENMTKASEKLYISQPYLSKFVRKIENDLGVKIFVRSHRSVRLTYAGKRYFEYLQQIVSTELSMKKELDLIAKHKKGTINIGINPALGTSILPIILPVFEAKYPFIKINLFEENADTLENMIVDSIVDIGIGVMPVLNDQLTYETIYDDFMYLLVHKSSVLYKDNVDRISPFPYKLSVLNDEPLITLKNQYGLGRLVSDFYNKYHLVQNVKLTTNTIYTAVGLTRKGMGSTFIPTTGMAWVTFNDCNLYKLNSDILKANFVLFYKNNKSISPPLLDLISIIKSYVHEAHLKFSI